MMVNNKSKYQAEILPFFSNLFSDLIFISGRQNLIKLSPDFEELIVIIPHTQIEQSNSLMDAFTFNFNINENKITFIPFDFNSDSILTIFKMQILDSLHTPVIINFSMLSEISHYHQFLNILSFLPPKSIGYLIQKFDEQYFCQFMSPPLPQNLSATTKEIYEFLLEEKEFQTIESIQEALNLESYHKVQKTLKKLTDLGQLCVKSRKFNKKEYMILNKYKEKIS